MRRLLQLSLLCALSVGTMAASLRLLWDENQTSDNVIAYYVYERIGTNWNRIGTSTTNGFALSNVSPGSHTWSVTASNILGESAFAMPISLTIPTGPAAPGNLSVSIVVTVTVP